MTTTDNGMVWHAVPHAALPMRISKLAARLTAGFRAAAASSGDPDQTLLTPSAAQHTAVGPQTAPDPQAALLSLGRSDLPQQSAAGLDTHHVSASTVPKATPFVEGACSYAAAMQDAIDDWVSKHRHFASG
jgi:dihydroxyacetone kinase DhaKLM complex PTS-EIIA-like component DhaM